MEKSFKLSIDPRAGNSGPLRAEIVLDKAAGDTRITVSTTIPNRFGAMSIPMAQALLLRTAVELLQEEILLLESTQADHTPSQPHQ